MADFDVLIRRIHKASNCAYSVYKSCKNAGDSFRGITAEVDSLRSLLLDLDNEFKKPCSSFRHLSYAQERQLGIRLINLSVDLRSAKRVITLFLSLDTRDPRYRDSLADWNRMEADAREELAAHGRRLQLLLNGQDVATRSTIEKDTEAGSLSLSALNVQSNETRKDTPTGRRNASECTLRENGLPSDNRLPDDNITEPDVDALFEAKGRLHPSNDDIPRSAEKVYPSFRHFYNDTDASMTSFGSFTSVESVGKVTHDVTAASVTCDGKQLPTEPHLNWSLLRDEAYHSRAYYFVKETKRWTRAKAWNYHSVEDLSPIMYAVYSLEFSLEEVFSGAVRHVDVQRTVMYPKHRYATSVENISLNVQAERGLRENEAIYYLEAGNQNADFIESLSFILKRKNHDVFQTKGSNLAHEICVSFLEAREGWKREIRHPSGAMIEVYANGPTNVGHFLAMERLGLPYRLCPGYYGNLLLWIRITDIEEIPTRRLNHLKSRGGAYFARIKREDVIYESTDDPPFPLFTFGDQATRHGEMLTDGFG